MEQINSSCLRPVTGAETRPRTPSKSNLSAIPVGDTSRPSSRQCSSTMPQLAPPTRPPPAQPLSIATLPLDVLPYRLSSSRPTTASTRPRSPSTLTFTFGSTTDFHSQFNLNGPKLLGGPDSPKSQTSDVSYAARSRSDLEAASQNTLPPTDELAGSTVHEGRFWLLSIAVGLGLFLAIMDSSIVATSIAAIGEDLQLSTTTDMNWIALAYTLSYLSFTALFGRIADVVGRRNALAFAFAIFCVFSVACGCAHTLGELIFLRAVQGIGGAGLYSLSMIIWPEIAPVYLRKHIATVAGVVIAVSGVLGPVLGGVFTTRSSWRWIFWMNGPIGAVAAICFVLSWPKDEQLPNINLRSWRSIDFLGSFLLVASACMFTCAFQNMATDPQHWTRPLFLGTLIPGCLCGIALFLWEWLVEARWEDTVMPALPIHLLKNRVYTAVVLNTACLGYAFFSVIFSLPMRFEFGDYDTEMMAGIKILPMLGGVALGSFFSGMLTNKHHCHRQMLLLASALMTLGCGLETIHRKDRTELSHMATGFQVFIGLGLGMAASATTIFVTDEAPKGDHAVAQGILAQSRVFGGSVGIAIYSKILADNQVHTVGRVIVNGFFSSGATGSPLDPKLKAKMVSEAFQFDMIICTVVTATGCLFAASTFWQTASEGSERAENEMPVPLRPCAGQSAVVPLEAPRTTGTSEHGPALTVPSQQSEEGTEDVASQEKRDSDDRQALIVTNEKAQDD